MRQTFTELERSRLHGLVMDSARFIFSGEDPTTELPPKHVKAVVLGFSRLDEDRSKAQEAEFWRSFERVGRAALDEPHATAIDLSRQLSTGSWTFVVAYSADELATAIVEALSLNGHNSIDVWQEASNPACTVPLVVTMHDPYAGWFSYNSSGKIRFR